jgi:hypothetical protein
VYTGTQLLHPMLAEQLPRCSWLCSACCMVLYTLINGLAAGPANKPGILRAPTYIKPRLLQQRHTWSSLQQQWGLLLHLLHLLYNLLYTVRTHCHTQYVLTAGLLARLASSATTWRGMHSWQARHACSTWQQLSGPALAFTTASLCLASA